MSVSQVNFEISKSDQDGNSISHNVAASGLRSLKAAGNKTLSTSAKGTAGHKESQLVGRYGVVSLLP